MKSLTQVRGASLIAAVFLITVLAFLGLLMTRLTIHGTVVTLNELLSSRALLAAESGIEWAVYDIIHNTGGTGIQSTPVALESSSSVWFKVDVKEHIIDKGGANESSYYVITSTGMAGGSSANPVVQRVLSIQFMTN